METLKNCVVDSDCLADGQQISSAGAIYKRCSRRRRLALRLLEFVLRPLVWLSKADKGGDLSKVRQVLVFEPGSLGDMVMLMPFLRSLRAHYPEARITVLCREHGTKKKGSYDAINKDSVE